MFVCFLRVLSYCLYVCLSVSSLPHSLDGDTVFVIPHPLLTHLTPQLSSPPLLFVLLFLFLLLLLLLLPSYLPYPCVGCVNVLDIFSHNKTQANISAYECMRLLNLRGPVARSAGSFPKSLIVQGKEG